MTQRLAEVALERLDKEVQRWTAIFDDELPQEIYDALALRGFKRGRLRALKSAVRAVRAAYTEIERSRNVNTEE